MALFSTTDTTICDAASGDARRGEHAGGEKTAARFLDGAGAVADDIGADGLGIDAPIALHHHLLCAGRVCTRRLATIRPAMAAADLAEATIAGAMLADLPRGVVLVDIINWPVSFLF